MKKIIFCILLFTVTLSISQNKSDNNLETFSRVYKSIIKVDKDIKSPEEKCDISVFFNYMGENRIKVFFGEKSAYFKIIGNVEQGKTTNGSKYQLVNVIEEEQGFELTFQFFDDIGVLRLIFGTGDYYEYYEE